jgi:putative transposase
MARIPRIVVPNHPHHVVQRGHNRGVVFAEESDYLRYLDHLKECKQRFCIKIYAYCLMTNHVHLILDPGEDVASLALMMKRVSARTTRYVNRLEGRCGTLWEGRYKSSPIQREDHLLACCRYVELNPVRAGIVDMPGKYRWSSYRQKVGLECGLPWVEMDFWTPRPGGISEEIQRKYGEWMEQPIPHGEWDLIRQAVQRGQLTGTARFVEEIAERVGRRIELRGRGRPRKDSGDVPTE